MGELEFIECNDADAFWHRHDRITDGLDELLGRIASLALDAPASEILDLLGAEMCLRLARFMPGDPPTWPTSAVEPSWLMESERRHRAFAAAMRTRNGKGDVAFADALEEESDLAIVALGAVAKASRAIASEDAATAATAMFAAMRIHARLTSVGEWYLHRSRAGRHRKGDADRAADDADLLARVEVVKRSYPGWKKAAIYAEVASESTVRRALKRVSEKDQSEKDS